MKALITGGRGFVGSHLVEHILKNTDWDVVVFDKLGYASTRIEDIDVWDANRDRVTFYAIDLTLPVPMTIAWEVEHVGVVFHLAAESHVDRSIENPVPFVKNNVLATAHMLEYARHIECDLFVNFSTDEVYGPAPAGRTFAEFEWHRPSNPYAASKSAQEALGIAWSNTYGVPVITTHTMNIFGERQHPEKFVPMVVGRVLRGETVTIHGDADGNSGSRMYLHARNLSDALLHVAKQPLERYDEWNIAGLREVSNLEMAKRIADVIGKPLHYEMVDFHSSRPGHDLRYALDSSKLLETGYRYPVDFDESLERTVRWMIDRHEWLGR